MSSSHEKGEANGFLLLQAWIWLGFAAYDLLFMIDTVGYTQVMIDLAIAALMRLGAWLVGKRRARP